MKAIVMTAPGGSEVLQLQDVPEPKLENERQLLVRLKAAGVNPIDTKLRKRGTFYPDRMPAILGCDGAGMVEAIGPAVENFKVGDAVYFCNAGLGGHPGNYAQWATIDERFVAHKPTSLNFAEAAAAPLVLITAWESLYDRARLQPGQTALIHAGAGGVGHVAVQLAKLQGASVCTTVGSPEKAQFVESLGADRAIFYKETDFVQETLNWTSGEGVDVAFDTVGGATFAQTFPAVRIYGHLVSILSPATDTNWKIARDRNLSISLELMLTPMVQGKVSAQQDQAKILQQCARLIDQGDLKIHLGTTFALKNASAAHELLEKGSMMGKIALLIEE